MGYIGEILAEGKTKQVISIPNEPDAVILKAKDDITAGDGAKHDIIPGKGEWANTITCNVFRMLKRLRDPLPVAFIEQVDERSFMARRCDMVPLEIVIRRNAFGSYLKRHPNVEKGRRFENLQCEFFLKTAGKRFKLYGFPIDDPHLIFNEGGGGLAWIYHPAVPVNADSFLMKVPMSEILDGLDPNDTFIKMKKYASQAFLLLEEAWKKAGGKLVDFKVEFGVDKYGNLLLADVIDNDSWRVMHGDAHLDKQLYRDGSSLQEVAKNYKLVADITSTFV